MSRKKVREFLAQRREASAEIDDFVRDKRSVILPFTVGGVLSPSTAEDLIRQFGIVNRHGGRASVRAFRAAWNRIRAEKAAESGRRRTRAAEKQHFSQAIARLPPPIPPTPPNTPSHQLRPGRGAPAPPALPAPARPPEESLAAVMRDYFATQQSMPSVTTATRSE